MPRPDLLLVPRGDRLAARGEVPVRRAELVRAEPVRPEPVRAELVRLAPVRVPLRLAERGPGRGGWPSSSDPGTSKAASASPSR
ncbi:MAG TPA: hypothetical protein VHO07_29090 [Streptosporangiaceae bacterium]|nr:hypothetical protein [Streptosporangiaceae bacterium]